MLVKQGIDISFAQGLDTKTDPKRVQTGKFLKLQNMVFQKGGLLQKRNGYGALASLPEAASYLTTFNGNLTAIGNEIQALNNGAEAWISRGNIQPLSLSTLPLIRNNLNQTACDSAISSNNLVCTVYLESNGTTTTNKYAIADAVTGQNIVAPAAIPVTSGIVSGGMRVFALGNNFIILFTNTITATAHLQYVAINIFNTSTITANTDIASSYEPSATLSFDGQVVNNNLYIAYNTASGGQSVKVTYLSKSLVLATPTSFAGFSGPFMSVAADVTVPASPVIYITFADNAVAGYNAAVDQNLNVLKTPFEVINNPAANLTSAAQNGFCYIFYEAPNAYAWDGTIPSNYIVALRTSVADHSLPSPTVSIRSVGLASKAFIVNGVVYYLAAYQSQYQPTYFVINGSLSTSANPVIAAKLAYENGGGYLTKGLPNVSIQGGDIASFPYLYKDLIQAVNKNTAVLAGNQVAGIYSQTGINLAFVTFGTNALDTAEIGNNLHISGGFLWMYDGYLPLEHNFFLWPDTDQTNPTDTAAWSTTGGAMHAQPDGSTNANAYYYQITYEWTDNQGNAFRSAPSIPIAVTTTGSGTTGSVIINGPMLRLTMKTPNPVKIVIYRWSVAQQNYFQVTSISAPLLNDTTVDSFTFTDTLADASILGNNLIYTTGGVIEDVNAPASDLLTLFDSRLWLVDSEDANLVWFSKQVIESTPVEMSDLLTIYVPPNVGTSVSTGPITSIATMDDKVIFGKKNAFVYINGTGPDNTGANSQYSQAIFITSTVGCANQKSIVLTPNGLMFQSDKGIWLLGRDLSTSYIGAPVEDFVTGANVTSAVLVPETNQVRFTLDTGITLMYDYFYDQWGTFINVPAISSCIFQDQHTFINSSGKVFQESPGTYLDGSSPVLMMFQTGPIRLGDLQNYQRVYYFYLLGTYLSPHKLSVSMYYDYSQSPEQMVLIAPINYSPPYGSSSSQSPYGQGQPYGGPPSAEDWRVFPQRQRCQAMSIQVQEIFDATFGTQPGAGLTLSGLNVVCAFKRVSRPQSAATSVG